MGVKTVAKGMPLPPDKLWANSAMGKEAAEQGGSHEPLELGIQSNLRVVPGVRHNWPAG